MSHVLEPGSLTLLLRSYNYVMSALLTGTYLFSGKYECIYGGQNYINLKDFDLLTGMYSLKPASRLVERYCRVVICAFSMKNLILNNFYKVNKY
jgi:hypothetical protein